LKGGEGIFLVPNTQNGNGDDEAQAFGEPVDGVRIDTSKDLLTFDNSVLDDRDAIGQQNNVGRGFESVDSILDSDADLSRFDGRKIVDTVPSSSNDIVTFASFDEFVFIVGEDLSKGSGIFEEIRIRFFEVEASKIIFGEDLGFVEVKFFDNLGSNGSVVTSDHDNLDAAVSEIFKYLIGFGPESVGQGEQT